MTDVRSIKDLKGKSVVNVTTGEKLADVSDTMIDPSGTRVAAVIISVGDFLQPEYQYIHSDDVEVWGHDVILVRSNDVLVPEAHFPRTEEWLKTSDYLRRRTVLDSNGTRLGQVNDILVDADGRFAGYRLGQVDVEGPLAESKYIPATATQSVGPDYVIVDTGRFRPEDVPEEVVEETREDDWDDSLRLFGGEEDRD
jgi:uncharacterized protein YrrD